MSVEHQTAIELSEQELDVVAGGVATDESFAPTKLPKINISDLLKDIKFPNFLEIDQTKPKTSPVPPGAVDIKPL